MPTSYTEPFSGQQGSTCSVATAHAAQHADAYKKAGMSEVKWSSMDKQGGWQVFKTKLEAGEITDGQVLGAFKHPDFGTFKGEWNQSLEKIKLRCIVNGPIGPGKGQFLNMFPSSIEKFWIKNDAVDIKWAGTKATAKIVSDVPKVVLKPLGKQEGFDELVAKLKKGEVKDGDVVGSMNVLDTDYLISVDSLSEKIVLKTKAGQSFPLTLDNFESFYVKGDQKITWGTISPATKAEKAVVSTGKLTDEDVAQMFVKTKDDLAKEMGIPIKGANPVLDAKVYEAIAQETGYKALEIKQKIDRYKASGKKLSALKKKTLKPTSKVDLPKTAPKPPAEAPKVDPSLVPSQATVDKVVNELVSENDSLSMALSYTDTDVAKAYVRAKDKAVADSNGKWTLYSKSDELDNAVFSLIRKELPNIANADIKTQVARYISEVKKLSQLKKELITKGQLKAKAPTLKGPKTLAEQATEKNGVKEAVVENPKVEIFDFGGEKPYVYNLTQTNAVALSDSPQVLYDKLLKVSDQITHSKPSFKTFDGYQEGDVLSIVRVLDAKKAELIGKENAHLFENKLVEWLKSGEGKQHVLKKQEMAKLAQKAAAELPADSSLFKVISDSEASTGPLDARKITDVQSRLAVKKYTGGSYSDINGALRAGRANATANSMDRAFKLFDRDVLLHRGTSPANFGVRTQEELYSLVGQTISDRGFTSSSVGGKSAFGGTVTMEIEAPKGVARGVYVEKISNHPGEFEMLLAARTKFKVLSVRREGGRPIVRVRVVP